MRKSVKWLIGSVLTIALIVLACLYFIPKTTPIDIILDTQKRDSAGNELGSMQITLKGNWKEYLFKNNRLTFTIDDFDHLYDLRPWTAEYGTPPYSLEQSDEDGYNCITYVANSTVTGEDSVFLYVLISEDLSRWEFFPAPSIYTSEELRDDPSFDLVYRTPME